MMPDAAGRIQGIAVPRVPWHKTCIKCAGSGWQGEKRCSSCQGRGQVSVAGGDDGGGR